MRVLVPALILLAAACEGKNLSYDETRAYFQKHAGDLHHIIELVEDCGPVYPSQGVYNAIRLNDAGGFNPTCANGGASRLDEIKAGMRKAEVLQAEVRLTSEGDASYADFALYSAGLAVSGIGVDVIYYANLAEVPQPPFEEGYEHKSLNAEPDHWFWRRWAT